MTVDVEGLKSRVDIVRVAEGYTELKQRSRAWVGRCPLPEHEDKSPSFAVYEDSQSWHCFGCGAGGDVIALVQAVEGVDFREAVRRLGGEDARSEGGNPAKRKKRISREPVEQGPPTLEWQAAAWELVTAAERTLWSDQGTRARAYLAGRGLSEETMRARRLGYVPGGPQQWVDAYGLKVPCGITIPWVIDDDLWQVKVRRAAGPIKYMQVAGGSAHGLYLVDQVKRWHPAVLILEGEFDAMCVNQMTHLVAGVALGSASNTLRPRWLARLLPVERVYTRLDDDNAGRSGLARLREMSARVRPVQVPLAYKDVNEWLLADQDGLRVWLEQLSSDK